MESTYIWGAGHFGALAALDMEQKGKAIAGFIDSNKKLQGKRRLGYEVFSPEYVIKNKEKIIIAIFDSVNEIAKNLEDNNYVYGRDFDVFEEIKWNYNTLRKKNTANINDLELVENIDVLFENEIVLYGTGKCGENAIRDLKMAGIPVHCFCDADSNKWGQYIDDIEIISPSKLKQLDKEKNIIIIVTPFIDSIFDDISALKLRTEKIYTKFGLDISLLQNINHYKISEMYRDFQFSANKLRNFSLKDALNFWIYTRLAPIMDRNCNILIYQPGKVGSTTICTNIRKSGLACVHEHRLNGIDEEGKDILKKLDILKIITLVREPISRNISRFFQYFEGPSLGPIICVIPEMQFMEVIIERLKHGYHEIPYYNNNILHNPFDWFDKELKAVFGVDIYAHPFDKEKGYSIIKQGNIEVLAMKLEKLNSLESVIGEFINVPNFKLINANEGDKKPYKYLYKNVKDAIKIPREVFDEYYKNNPKMDHFYSEEEKAAFLKKWEKNIAD